MLALEGWFAAELTVCPGSEDGPCEVGCPIRVPPGSPRPEAPNATPSMGTPQKSTLASGGQGWELWADSDHRPSTEAAE